MHEEMSLREIAALAKLTISPEEEAALAADMAQIIAFAQALHAVDTDGVPPTRHIVPLVNVLREDAPQPSIDRETLLALAPERHEGFLVVPQTLQGGEA